MEVLLAVGITCTAAAGALAMLAAADFQIARAGVEGLLGGQIRYFQERFAGMSYSTLSALIPPGQTAGTISEEGFFLTGSPPQFPWKLDARLERNHPNTANEFISVKMNFSWQEPAPGFPRAQNVTRTLNCPPLQRTRF